MSECFNKANANPRLLFKVTVSPAAVMTPLLGPGQKPDPDKGEGEVELMGFLIVSQSELPVPNCSVFGGQHSTVVHRGADTGHGAWVCSLWGVFFPLSFVMHKVAVGLVPLCHIAPSRTATAK